ncbi:MAG: cytochrome c [Thiotrichales bacterium]|nr:MAG: cytochrome c [Thiotrichales bacterium]
MRVLPGYLSAPVRASLLGCLFFAGMTTGGTVLAGDFFNGEKIYKTYCQNCHGANGRGLIGGAPNFARGQGLMKTDAGLYETIVAGRNAMPAFRGVLKEEEFFDVITYIRSFY